MPVRFQPRTRFRGICSSAKQRRVRDIGLQPVDFPSQRFQSLTVGYAKNVLFFQPVERTAPRQLHQRFFEPVQSKDVCCRGVQGVNDAPRCFTWVVSVTLEGYRPA